MMIGAVVTAKGDAPRIPGPSKVSVLSADQVGLHLTKLRYDARASMSFADNLLATPGIGGAAVA